MVYCCPRSKYGMVNVMNGGSRIIAIGSSGDGQAERLDSETGVSPPGTGLGDTPPLDLDLWEAPDEAPPFAAASPGLAARLPAIVAFLAIAGWTAFYAWANRALAVSGRAPADWAALIAAWTLPVILVCLVWLVVVRSSTREVARFGNAARLLSDESALLERRLLTVNRELSLAREFIAAQSRDLESLGRVASERLSANADRLQSLVAENGSRVETIGEVSATALVNMEKLRGQLPVIASSAKDVTNNIANAGRTAHGQIEELIRGFNRLNEFGQASETQVFALRDHVNETITGLAEQCGHLERMVAARFGELAAQGDEMRAQLDRNEVDALAAVRTRAKALVDELDAAREATTEAESKTVEVMSARIAALQDEAGSVASQLRESEERARGAWREAMAALEAEIAERSQAHLRSAEEAASLVDTMTGKIVEAQTGMGHVTNNVRQSQLLIDDVLVRLGQQVTEAKSRLDETEERLGSLTEAGVRLFELIHASANQAGQELPGAIGRSERALVQIEARAKLLGESMGQIGGESDALAARMEESRSALAEITGSLDGKQDHLRERVTEHLSIIQGLSKSLAEIDERQEAVAGKARDHLTSAIAEMESAALNSLASIDNQSATGIERISREIKSRSAEAVAQAIHNAAAEISGQLEQAASHAAGVSREAAIQLRDQLAKVVELVANLESRVDRVRERAEEQVNNDFSRRVALITESLNSNAIDIAKVFSADVSGKAWERYLRGDRGIFTRRAVSLIDNSEARSIQQIYERDDDFREHVSRYIHDFEAMLRQVLSTRDGTAMGVTLLSSDMGKLYVALAQGIERLRS